MLKNYFTQLTRCRHRGLIVLSGERDWATSQAHNFILRSSQLPAVTALWLTDETQQYANVRQLHPRATSHYLGGEYDVLVFDGYSGFSPNAFCAAADTVAGGGIIFLIAPELSIWPDLIDPDFSHAYHVDQPPRRFIQRLIKQLQATADSPENQFLRIITPDTLSTDICTFSDHAPVKELSKISAEQSQLVAAIIRSMNGRTHRPLVVSAARGRGKSTAVGMALADWLNNHSSGRIIITGPGRDAVATAFRWAESLVETKIDNDVLQVGGASLVYFPVDILLRDVPDADVVVVDEAAAIPLPVLERLLVQYSRLVFVTTTLGYEGSGRGFALRFSRILDRYSRQWRRASLSSPIRWANDDSLELWLQNVFLLADHDVINTSVSTAETENISVDTSISDAAEIRCFCRDELILHENILAELFRLLVDAHYRTEPDDLRYLLDAPGVQVWAVFVQKKILAAAIVVEEDALPVEVIERIAKNCHRPRGHLLAQTIALQTGIYNSMSLSAWRIVRIAVQSEYQRQSLGTKLLSSIIDQARIAQIDYVGSSFAVDADILSFWIAARFLPLRMGLNRDHATASYSVLVAYPLSDAAQVMSDIARERFAEQLSFLLPIHWQDVEHHMLAVLYPVLPLALPPSAIDRQQVKDYLRGAIAFDIAHLALKKMLHWCLPAYLRETYSAEKIRLPMRAVLQCRTWPDLIKMEKFSGKKALEIQLRDHLRCIVESADGILD